MFGFRKAAPAPNPAPSGSDPEPEKKTNLTTDRRTSSEPVIAPKSKGSYFDDEDDDDDYWGRKPTTTASSRTSAAAKNKYKNDFRDSGGLENQSVQELEGYAVYKAEETTQSVNNLVKIAEDIKGDATRTLDMLHQQGEQITRTHNMVVETERDLSRGEKLLNNLGGMFSKPWRPKKTREITGPKISLDNTNKKGEANKEEREKLGLGPGQKGRSGSNTPHPEPTNAYQQIENEKAKQDEGLSDLSNILDDLKGMAVDMGSELDRQNKALDHLSDDVDELNSRVKGANQRARKLLAK
ncbi:putative SNAP25 homologous protein SNAP30 [Arachis duranensis]|uniref:SNAP25 homologous protein SNAP30 n=1 Tax=Arachis duranensis TaxID=130453 RepID=A0A6P4DEA8_ARADU|nr:putative SNAP25 homologous protein SNAP30 [Arachis duranensis]XP_057760469.1 putative SNAP25 homologous protein SNAP30 [Arachis stenosperma]